MEKNSPKNDIAYLFDDLQEGLIQAIDYANGAGSARIITRRNDSELDIDKDQRREINIQPDTE